MAGTGGARPGAGNPGYGKQLAVKEGVQKLTPKWFELAEKWLNGKDRGLKLTAFSEIGKLLGKVIPTQTDLTSGGKPIVFVPNEIIEKYKLNDAVPSSPEPNSEGHPPGSSN